jgi:hypothetical protein
VPLGQFIESAPALLCSCSQRGVNIAMNEVLD